jgi:hypothetical protein
MQKSESPPSVVVAPLEKVSKGLVVALSVSVCIFAIFVGLWASWNVRYTRGLCFVQSLCGENGTVFFWNARFNMMSGVASSGSSLSVNSTQPCLVPRGAISQNCGSAGGCGDNFAG